MTCSIPDCPNIAERSGKCATHARQERAAEKLASQPPKKQKAIKRVSQKMSDNLRIYAMLRKEFLEANPLCEVYRDRAATEIHHMRGRATEELLFDTNYWLAVSREAHQWIELHPEEAKAKGYSLSRLASTEPI